MKDISQSLCITQKNASYLCVIQNRTRILKQNVFCLDRVMNDSQNGLEFLKAEIAQNYLSAVMAKDQNAA